MLSRRLILAVGIVTALSPLVWGPFFDAIDVGLGGGLFLAWQLLPFGLLAAAQGETPIGRTASVLALIALAALTTATQVAVLLFPQSSTDALAFIFVPIYLSIGVGAVIGLDISVRAVWRRLRS